MIHELNSRYYGRFGARLGYVRLSYTRGIMYASDDNKHAAVEGIEHAERRLDEVEALYPGLFDRILCGGE